MVRQIASLAILTALAAAPLTAFAAKYTVTPTFVGAFTNDGSFTPIPGRSLYSFLPAILQFDFIVSTSDFAADQYGFANGVFTIETSGLTNTSAPGWNPSPIPNVDSNGATPGGVVPLLSDNADLAAQDLKDILIGVATPLTTNPAVDPRYQFGRGTTANYNAGTAYFDYQGGLFWMTTAFTQASALYRDGLTNRYIGLVDADALLPVATILTIPEPSTGVLMALALAGVAACRRA
jgi:hypothetical protein